jgi:hypothetical protein
LEKHEKEKKERMGKNGNERGRAAAAVDAAGAAMGSVGLVVFGLMVWLGLSRFSTGVVLSVATIAWFLTAMSIWELREKVGRRFSREHSSTHSVVVPVVNEIAQSKDRECR